jgi:predicted RNase H-like nuclease (RuvC/YqgF family)
MSDNKDEYTELKIDVGILKTQVSMLTQLCNKMDAVIEKLSDNHDRMVNQIYNDMEKRKTDTVSDIKELHSRITTVDRNLSDKLELTERRIMDEIKSLRHQITEHNKKEDSEIKKILEWKWMAAGGIVVVVWLISNIKFDIIAKIFG